MYVERSVRRVLIGDESVKLARRGRPRHSISLDTPLKRKQVQGTRCGGINCHPNNESPWENVAFTYLVNLELAERSLLQCFMFRGLVCKDFFCVRNPGKYT